LGWEVLPGCGLVVDELVLEAGVQYSGPAVGELAQGLVVGFAAGAELAVVGAGAG
jgi:hypothetical protein